MLIQRRFIFKRTPFDIPLVIFFLSQVLSTLFSIDRHTSIFGYYSRFNGGLLSLGAYLLLYWAFVTNGEAKDVFRAIKASFISAAIVSLYGILEHFGYSFSCLMFEGKFNVGCWIQDVKTRVFATLGQPNWLAAYLAILIPVASGFSLNSKLKTQKFIWPTLLAVLFFLCLLFTGSKSGFLGLVVALGVFWFLTFTINRKQSKWLLKPFLILNSGYLILIVAFGSPFPQLNYKDLTSHFLSSNRLSPPSASPIPNQGPALEVGGTESGKIRQIVWKGAINVFKHYPVFGSGVETFAYSYYNFRPIEHNLVSEWDFLYNKAHNEYLNFLSTTGIFGLGTYILFIGSFIIWNFFQFKRQTTLNFALFSGWLSILVSNFFGFSVVLVSLYFYLIPAFIFVLFSSAPVPPPIRNLPPPLTIARKFLLVVLILTTGYLTLATISLWRADFYYSQGLKLGKQSEYALAYQELAKAINLSPFEPIFVNELSSITASLALVSSLQKNATAAGELAEAAISFSDHALKESPRNLNFWKTRIKVFYTLSTFESEYLAKSIESLQDAMKLSPTDPKLLYNLGLLYGKSGEVPKALSTIQKALELKPDYEEARNALAIFYEDLDQKDKALEQLKIIFQNKPNDPDLKARIEKLRK